MKLLKITTVILAALIAVSLCACSGGNSTATETTAAEQNETVKPVDTEAGAQTQPETGSSTAAVIDTTPVKGSDKLAFSEYDDGYMITGTGECVDAELIIPSHIDGKPVTRIDESAFRDNLNLKSVIIPWTVKVIDEDAFAGCENLESVTFSEGLESFDESAFYGCKAIKSLTLPSTLLSVDSYTFYGCSSLEEVTMLGCYDIRANSFAECMSLRSVVIKSDKVPEYGYSIKSNAFSGCKAVEKIIFAPGLSEIGSWNFADTANLKEVFLPDTIKKIDACVFLRSGLEKINYGGTEDEWKNVEIKEPLFDYEIVYNSEYVK